MSDTPNNITLFMQAVLASVQDVENALQQLYRERRVDVAVGAQLDILGKVVGQPRQDLDDDTYRRYIRARVSTNRSDGVVEDLITITDLIVDETGSYIIVRRGSTASVMVKVDLDSQTFALMGIVRDFLVQAVSAGVRLVVEFRQQTAADTFCFFGGVGKGFSSRNISVSAGKLAAAIQ